MADLILILGPMKSGKSRVLIELFNSLSDDIKFGVFHSVKNARDEGVRSRTGLEIDSVKIKSVSEILNSSLEIIGIDEIHMFDADNIVYIQELLRKGSKVVIAGLDKDYRGKKFSIIEELIKLSPTKIYYRKGRCEECGGEAEFTQILDKGVVVRAGLPASVVDDGTYQYKTVCEQCFI